MLKPIGGIIALKNIFTFGKYSMQVLEDHKFALIKKIQKIPHVPIKEFPQNYFIDVHYVLYFLSLFLKTRVQILENTIKNGNLHVEFVIDKDFEFSEKKFDEAFKRMLSMPKRMLVPYLNSCSAFHSALLLVNSNYSAAYVLLVVAIESLSNVCYSQGSHTEKIERFMIDFLPEERRFLSSELRYVDKKLTKDETSVLFENLLKSVYRRIRSKFAHFGEESPVASMIANKFKLAYIKTYKVHKSDSPKEKENEELNPSFMWFKRLVEEALIIFLFAQDIKEQNDLTSLLSERFITRLKARKPIKMGQPITPEIVYLQ